MSAEDWSPSDLRAVSDIRVVATTDPDEAAGQVERQRAQITLSADRLGLRMADEFIDIGYSGMSMDHPHLRLDHVAAHQVGYCVVATRDRSSHLAAPRPSNHPDDAMRAHPPGTEP